jgi:hypothetical protein
LRIDLVILRPRSASASAIKYNQHAFNTDITNRMRRAQLLGEETTIHPDTNGLPALAGGTPVRTRANRLIFGAPVLGEEEIASVAECIRSNLQVPGT